MKKSTRNILALALASAFVSAAAFADPPAGAGNGNAGGNAAAAPAATPPAASQTMPPQSNSHAADAMGNPTPNTPPATSNANTTRDNMKDEAKYPPGKGNWWKLADTNADGLLTGTEALSNPFVNTNFAAIDTNGDGLVSLEEYRIFYTNTANQGHH